MKANKVPILVISPTTRAGTNAANKLTKSMNSRLFLPEFAFFGFTVENISVQAIFAHTKETLDWPIT